MLISCNCRKSDEIERKLLLQDAEIECSDWVSTEISSDWN